MTPSPRPEELGAPRGLGTERTPRHIGRLPGAVVLAALALAATLTSCGPPPPEPLGPGEFAFGVFGDGPYYPWENGPWRRTLEDAAATDVDFFVHLGDMLWAPCSDELYRRRLDQLNALPFPVMYIPGDNEWVDCHGGAQGSHDPLDRLAAIRSIFFGEPGTSLGSVPMALTSQASDPDFSGFPEHVRWEQEGFVFATLHMVGSSNGLQDFDGWTDTHRREVEERTEAVLAWVTETFERAREADARGVVLFGHANVFRRRAENRVGHEPFREALAREVAAFQGEVLYVHGDSHRQRVDHPLRDADGEPVENFTRMETFGSPEIGWVRVVVAPDSGRFVRFEPRWLRGYW